MGALAQTRVCLHSGVRSFIKQLAKCCMSWLLVEWPQQALPIDAPAQSLQLPPALDGRLRTPAVFAKGCGCDLHPAVLRHC